MKGLAPAGAVDQQFDQRLVAARPHTCERREGRHADAQVCAFVRLCAPGLLWTITAVLINSARGWEYATCSQSTGGGLWIHLNQYGCSTAYSLPKERGKPEVWEHGNVCRQVARVWSNPCQQRRVILRALHLHNQPRPSSRVCSSSVGLSSTSVPPVDFVPPPQRRRRVGPSLYISLDVKRVHRSFISSVCLFPLEIDRACDYLIGKHISARLSLGSINHSI